MRKKRSIFSLITLLAFSPALSNENKGGSHENPDNQISLRLEDLCDTQVKERCLDLPVYVSCEENHPARIFYEEEVFPLISEFFSQYQISCHVSFESSVLENLTSSDETGVEIYLSQEDFMNRYKNLQEIDKNEENPDMIKETTGTIIPGKNIVIFDATWRTSPLVRYKPVIIPWEAYQETPQQLIDYCLREDAQLICHEVLHNLGVPHHSRTPGTSKDKIPNIMSYTNLDFEFYPLGGQLNQVQTEIIHSKIAGNNVHKAIGSLGIYNYIDKMQIDNN